MEKKCMNIEGGGNVLDKNTQIEINISQIFHQKKGVGCQMHKL